MAIRCVDSKPHCHAVEGIVGEIRRRDLGEKSRVERARDRPDEASAFAFPLDDCQIEAERVSDYDVVADEDGKLGPGLGKGRSAGHRGIINAVDTRGRRRYRTWWPHPSSQSGGLDVSADESRSGELDEEGLARIEARGLGVDRDRVETDERRATIPLPHRLLRCSARPSSIGRTMRRGRDSTWQKG